MFPQTSPKQKEQSREVFCLLLWKQPHTQFSNCESKESPHFLLYVWLIGNKQLIPWLRSLQRLFSSWNHSISPGHLLVITYHLSEITWQNIKPDLSLLKISRPFMTTVILKMHYTIELFQKCIIPQSSIFIIKKRLTANTSFRSCLNLFSFVNYATFASLFQAHKLEIIMCKFFGKMKWECYIHNTFSANDISYHHCDLYLFP